MKLYKITIEELFFFKLLFLAQREEDKDDLLKDFILNTAHADPLVLLNRLQEVGIIVKSCKLPSSGDELLADNIKFNSHLIGRIFKHSGDLGESLWENYPDFTIINNDYVTLKNVAKHYNSIDEFFQAYGKSIGFNYEKHQQVLEIIEWAKEHNIIKENIAGFIINRGWEVLTKIKENKGDSNFIDYGEDL